MKSYAQLFPPVGGPDNPPCPLPDCGQTKAHHHVLPHQEEVIESTARFQAIVGGYGSAKTYAACVLGHLLSVAIPANRGLVGRRSYSKLEDSTLRVYLDVLDRSGVQYTPAEKRNGLPHRVTYANGSEVLFRETKDLGRFLGPAYGWGLFDEAQEEPHQSFKDFAGRLRLPAAWDRYKLMLATNPPGHRHWLATTFPEGMGHKGDFHLVQVASTDNPFLPPNYVPDLMKTHTPDEVRRIVGGRYGATYEGRPVYAPPFRYETHIGEPPFRNDFTLLRSWDFGFRCPAVTWHQFPKCQKGTTHWYIFAVLAGRDIEAEDFADKVLEFHARRFPNHLRPLTLDCGDRSGKRLTDTGPGPINRLSKRPWSLSFRTKECSVDPGLALIRKALTESCPCGRPVLVVHQSARDVVDGFSVGYHYPKDKPSQAPSEKPIKDGFYDNIMDSVRYAGECIFRGLRLDDKDIAALMEFPTSKADTRRNDWMGWPAGGQLVARS